MKIINLWARFLAFCSIKRHLTRSEIFAQSARKHGIRVTDIPLSLVNPGDLRGVPHYNN